MPKINILRAFFCGILFVAVFCTANSKAEESPALLPDVVWTISDLEKLREIEKVVENEQKNGFSLPEEISPYGDWNGIRVTDGNEEWTIMSMHVAIRNHGGPDFSLEKLDTTDFRKRLRENSIIRGFFPDGMDFLKRNGMLYVHTPGFPVERLDEIDPESQWTELRKKYRIALLSLSPELSLFPGTSADDLPPKTENEGSFLKRIREQRNKEDYTPSTNESTLFGWGWEEDGNYLGEMVVQEKEGTPQAEELRQRIARTDPFGVAGFLPDETEFTAFSGAYRWYPDDKAFGEVFFVFKGGNTYIPPEERDDPDRKYAFVLNPFIRSGSKEKVEKALVDEGYEVQWQDNLALASLWQIHEEAPGKERRVLENLNTAFKEVQSEFISLVQEFWNGSESWEKEKPVDIAFFQEGRLFVLAISVPPGGSFPDKISIDEFEGSVYRFFNEVDESYEREEDKKSYSLRFLHDKSETTEEGEFYSGHIEIGYGGMVYPLTSYVIAQKEEMLCLAVDTVDLMKYLSSSNSDENEKPSIDEDFPVEDFFEHCQPILLTRMEKSRRLKQENVPAPNGFLRANFAGIQARFELRVENSRWTYFMELEKNSLGLLGMLGSFLGEDVKSILP